MTKPITHSHNFIPHNSQATLKTNNEATSPKHIIQNIMYTPHQHISTVSALQSKNRHSKHFEMYTHQDEFKGHTPQSHLTKMKRIQGYKPSKFENNNNNETIKLIKSYSGSYNISQIRSSNALAKVVSQVQKKPNNFFFLKKKISVNETLQKNHSHKIKMSYIQSPIQHNQNANPTQSNNTNTNTQSMINADNNNSSSKHHSSNRNNNHNTNNNSNNTNNLVIIDNICNSNDNEKNLNSAHYNQCENSYKVPCNSALENYHQGSSLCFIKSNNSDTIKTRKRFNKSKTKKKTQKFSPNHIAILNMKDVLDELQNEEKPIKICKTIHKQTVKSKEEQKENKTLILSTINNSSTNKGFLCKCIPFCINTHKLIK